MSEVDACEPSESDGACRLRVGRRRNGLFKLDWRQVPAALVPERFVEDAASGRPVLLSVEQYTALAHEIVKSARSARGFVTEIKVKQARARALYECFKDLTTDSPSTVGFVEFWASLTTSRSATLPSELHIAAGDAAVDRLVDAAELLDELLESGAIQADVDATRVLRELNSFLLIADDSQKVVDRRLRDMDAYASAMIGTSGGVVTALDCVKTGCWTVFCVAGGAVFIPAGASVVAGAIGSGTIGAFTGLLDSVSTEVGQALVQDSWSPSEALMDVLLGVSLAGVSNGLGSLVSVAAKPASAYIVSKMGWQAFGVANEALAKELMKSVLEGATSNALAGAITDVAQMLRATYDPQPGVANQGPTWDDFWRHVAVNLISGGLAGSVTPHLSPEFRDSWAARLIEVFQ